MKVFVDIESTGKCPHNSEIIEAYFLKEDGDNFYMKCKPHVWSGEAEKIHGISKKKADQYDSFKSEFNRLLEWLPKEFTFVCYANTNTPQGHIHFDYGLFLNSIHVAFIDTTYYWDFIREYRIVPYSVHTLAKEALLNKAIHIPYELKPGNKRKSIDLSQQNVARVLNYSYKAHNCVEDVKACKFIYDKLMDIKNKSSLWISS